MAITKYIEKNKELWRVYIHVRSKKNRKLRSQKLVQGIGSHEEAIKVQDKEYKKACLEVARRETEGLTWEEIVNSWHDWYERYPSDRWDISTVRDYVAITKNWTNDWYSKPASKLTIADGHLLIESAKRNGSSVRRLYQIRTTVNVIFKWAIEHGKIHGVNHSPLFGIELARKPKDQVPEILNLEQLIDLLARAKKCEHEWYPLWKVDAHTGLRAAELEGLRKEDIQLVSREEAIRIDESTDMVKKYGLIRVQRQWKTKLKCYGELKARYWRTVPISSQLYWFLIDYLENNDFGSDEYGRRVFPLFPELRRGQQALVLKTFCMSQGIKPIKFHTLRACFATHLLAAGVSEAKVMKVGGWKDRETMMIYIRMAGIDEAGATEVLDLERNIENIPTESNVVSMFRHR